ncbi:ammonium transporter [Bifidobacterium tsurumiense]|uniref:ammonium transporter n=1 Tax=Bifidobacterium tsurumiense TaxID=356829 RepID=UPI0012B4047B|nr:ammonium transporter [Bifidobacterium tsurumiense]MDY4678583.1 ammonium transporter [Bifidobacterium tsurumiense]MSS12599.1 ammonium transporter [Bifidobacterium tsurumiense]
MDSGNAAWLLISASLVFLMTPALAFFYGGMVRSKAILNMLMMSAGAIAVTTVVWTLWGWSIAYAGRDIAGIFGDPATGFLLKDSMVSDGGVFTSAATDSNGVPVSINVAFQAAFAMITVALISGALAERVKYSTWMLFVALWITFVYAPMAHMVWNGGILSSTGAISQAIGAAAHDFAGGTVVHINAAVAALIVVLIIGKRKGFGTQPFRPHNVPFVMLGAFLLWFGWFGFNAGSAFQANGTAGYAWVSTALASASAMLAWGFTEKIRSGHYTAIGAASGIVAGLVAITPAADVVSPLWAIVIGIIAGIVCCLACSLKFKFGFDDSLDVVGIHGVGGLIGTLLVGLFAAGAGLLAGGDWKQLAVQVCVVVVAILYSAVVTAIIAFALEKTLGWRVSENQEIGGIDLADQGERGYDFAGSNGFSLKEAK